MAKKLITKLFIPIDNNFDFLERIYSLAEANGFCEGLVEYPDAKSKRARIEQLKIILKGQRYMTIGYEPSLPREADKYRFLWKSEFKRNSFQDFELLVTDPHKIEEWIVEHGKLLT